MRQGRVFFIAAMVSLATGCGIGPRHFRSLADPSPLNRARAVGFGDNQPDAVAVPALIDRLEDRDPVVRISAHQSLRKRTRRDFGFVAWADAKERAKAVEHWRAWWRSRQAGLANSRTMP